MTNAHPSPYSFQIGSPGTRPWLTVPNDWRRRDSSSYAVYWNDDLDYGRLLPRPSANEIPAFYDTDYYTHGAASEAPPFGLGWNLLRKLAWAADDGVEPDDCWWAARLGNDRKRVLEIGCGDGSTLARLAALGHDVTGLEPDPASRQVAAQKGVTVFNGSAETLPAELENGSFDCVIFLHSLEHTLSPETALSNAHRLLAPGGQLIVEVPNNGCRGIAHFGNIWLFLDIPRHLNFFTTKSLGAMISAAGFATKNCDYVGYCMQFAPVWLQEQAKIARAYGSAPSRNGWLSQLRYLLKTRRAKAAEKYCAIRITSIKEAL